MFQCFQFCFWPQNNSWHHSGEIPLKLKHQLHLNRLHPTTAVHCQSTEQIFLFQIHPNDLGKLVCHGEHRSTKLMQLQLLWLANFEQIQYFEILTSSLGQNFPKKWARKVAHSRFATCHPEWSSNQQHLLLLAMLARLGIVAEMHFPTQMPLLGKNPSRQIWSSLHQSTHNKTKISIKTLSNNEINPSCKSIDSKIMNYVAKCLKEKYSFSLPRK